MHAHITTRLETQQCYEIFPTKTQTIELREREKETKIQLIIFESFPLGSCHGQQEDPCKTKARVVGDATYCDRYWECVDGQAELYDCPNGLVFAGKLV